MASLPSFLHRPASSPPNGPYLSAVFNHKPPLASAHALWWPHRNPETRPDVVVFFIPGNPGLIDLYTPFLIALQDKSTVGNLAILAQAHINHTPGIHENSSLPSSHNLTSQVQSALEAFDALSVEFSQSKILLIGHSVGSWVSLQLLKARPNAASGAFLLFPTICNIADTPNGRKLSSIFKPIPREILSRLSYLTRFIPFFILQRLFPDWPAAQLRVLRNFLDSPSSISAALSMADQEMQTIRGLDVALLQEHRHRLWFYFGERDDWVGEQKDNILSRFKPDPGALRITHGNADIPHAFCINHGESLAQQCCEWLHDLD